MLNEQKRVNKQVVRALIDQGDLVKHVSGYVVSPSGHRRFTKTARHGASELQTVNRNLRELALKWQTEAKDEPEGSPSHSVLLYCSAALLAALPPGVRWKRHGNPQEGFSYEWNSYVIRRDPARPTVWRIDHPTTCIGRPFHNLSEARQHCEQMPPEES